MIRFIIALNCFAVLLFTLGCDRPEATSEDVAPAKKATPAIEATTTPVIEATTSSTPSTTLLLQEPVKLQRYESPTQALQQWYALRNARPALLLYSNEPMLQSTSSIVQKNLLAQLADHNDNALRSDITDPAILPFMTVSSALKADLFSAVYWVIPTSGDINDLSIETFRSQMSQFSALDDKEVASFTLQKGVFSGTVSGLPFRALHPQAELDIKGPVAFHFDLSYLSPLYKNEIKTPLFPLIYQTLKHLRDQQLVTIAASFSYSQIFGAIPLGSRFVGDVFEQLFNQPERLEESLPETWQLRANALYLPSLFSVQEAGNILLQLANMQPDDASLYYGLYQMSREVSAARNEALRHLAEAVRHDPVYALEYLALAPLANEKGRSDEALRVLQLAHEALPDNPFVTLELAKAYIEQGQGSNAQPLLEHLLAQSWSPTIYPGMPQFLQQLLTDAGK